jgi:hypothetical protein
MRRAVRGKGDPAALNERQRTVTIYNSLGQVCSLTLCQVHLINVSQYHIRYVGATFTVPYLEYLATGVLRDGAKLEVRVSDEISLANTSDLIPAAMLTRASMISLKV